MKPLGILLATVVAIQFTSIEAYNRQEDTGHAIAQTWVACGKSYVRPDQVHIADQEIFVEIEEAVVRVQGICVDKGGLYFDALHRDDSVWFMWICSCGKKNEGYLTHCKRCGRKKPEDS